MTILINVEIELSLSIEFEEFLKSFADVRIVFRGCFDPCTGPLRGQLFAKIFGYFATRCFVQLAAHEENGSLILLFGFDFTDLIVDRFQFLEGLFTSYRIN